MTSGLRPRRRLQPADATETLRINAAGLAGELCNIGFKSYTGERGYLNTICPPLEC